MSRFLRTSAVVLAAAGALLAGSPAASADTVPFTDQNAKGALGLCDTTGHQITSGSIDTKPFVFRAVSTVAAPAGYGSKDNAKASLYAYQPRQGVDPGDWSGQQLGGTSVFSNSAHPMADQTILDYSLADWLQVYPVKWDGLVQLRMFFGAPDKTPQTYTYPAATIRVQGDRWTLVQGGDVDCTDGKAISTERLTLPQSAFDKARASISASASRAAASRSAASVATPASGSRTPAATPGGSADPGGTDATDAAAPVAAAGASSGKSSGAPASLMAGLLAGVVLAAGAFVRHRRRVRG